MGKEGLTSAALCIIIIAARRQRFSRKPAAVKGMWKAMKKLTSLLMALLLLAALCGNAFAMSSEELAESFNNSEDVIYYTGMGYTMEAAATDSGMSIHLKLGDTDTTLNYTMDGTVLTGVFPEEDSFAGLYYSTILMDIIETRLGYDPGDYPIMANAPEAQDFTLENDGWDITENADGSYTFRIDTERKATPVDLSGIHAVPEDFADSEEYIRNGSYSSSFGYVRLYSENETEDAFNILAAEKHGLGDSAYRSVLALMEFIYGKDTADAFAAGCPDFSEDRQVGDFTVDVDPELDPFYASIKPSDDYQAVWISNYTPSDEGEWEDWEFTDDDVVELPDVEIEDVVEAPEEVIAPEETDAPGEVIAPAPEEAVILEPASRPRLTWLYVGCAAGVAVVAAVILFRKKK